VYPLLRPTRPARDRTLPELMLLNVNIPAVKLSEISGVVLTRRGVRRYIDVFESALIPVVRRITSRSY